jgi:filamentous hemagglutinin
MAQLTSDIVWLVEQTVTLADGSTATVLVPQVYLRLRPGDINENGALLAGENVHLNLRGDLVNSGDIAGRQVVSINATNLHHLQGGAISGRAVGLQATQDINIIGATVTAQDVLSVRAGGDVTVASTTQTHSGYGDSTSYVNRVAGLYVTNPGGLGVLSVNAGGDITLQAAQIHNAGVNGLTQLAAVGNVNLTTLTTGRSTDTTLDSKNYHRTRSTTHVGTTVQGAGNVVVQAGQDVNLTAAQLSAGNALAVQAGNNLNSTAVVDSASLDTAQASRKRSRTVQATAETVKGSTFTAGGDIALQAGNDITLQAATVASEAGGIALAAGRDVNLTTASETHSLQVDERRKKSGLLSSKTTTTHDKVVDTYAIGTTLSGETVQIAAGRDITTQAAQIAGTGDVLLAAGRNIDIGTGENTHVEQHDITQKKSGIFGGGGASGLGGVGFTAGSQKASSRTTLEQHTTTGSLIGSVEGNVTLVAGGDVTVTGSDLIAGRAVDDVQGVGGNIAMQGQNIMITSAEQTEHYESHQKSKSSGVTMALTGTPLDTVRNLQRNDRDAPTQTDKTHGALNEIAAAGLSTPQLAIGYGKSQSQSDTVIDTTTQRGSSLTAVGNITLKATGNGQTDANGKPLDGDITIIGSGITAGGTATFDAQRDVNLLASTDTQSQSSNSSSSTTQLTLAAPSWGDLSRHVHGGANSSGVRMSPYNSGRTSSESEQTAIGQTGTTVNADRVNIVSRQGDITVQGAQIDGVSGINLLAQEGDIHLLPGQTEQSWEEVNRSKQVGDLGGDGYAGTIGVRKERHTVDGSQSSQNAIRTSLSSVQGDVNVVAKGDVTGQGVDIVAGRDVLLAGRNVTLEPATDLARQTETHRVSQYGTTLALSGTGVQAVQAAEAAGRAAEAGDERLAALYAAQGAYAARDAGMSATSTAGNGGGNLIKITASVGGGSQSSQSGFADSTQVGSTVTAGRNVTVIATGDGTADAEGHATTGDITLRGAQVNAGNNVTLDAARDIELLSSQDTREQDSDHRSGSASVGVGFGLGGQQNGFTIELAAAAARGEAEGNSTTHQATQVHAGNTLTLSSGRDTTLHGAQAGAETVIAEVGRHLTLSSTQDAQTYDQRDQSASAGVSICVPPLCFGTSSGSVSASQTDINSNYHSTTQQTGIAAGSGGFDITVGGHTQLDGAVIASTATPELNRLSTGSLGVTHLDNVAEYGASSVSVSYSGSGTAGNQSGPGYSGGFSPGLAVPQSESTSSVTRSDIAAGTVEVRNGDASALDGLDRTVTELQQRGLENRFDLEEVQGNLEAGQLAGQVGFRAAGDIATAMQRNAVNDLTNATNEEEQQAALTRLEQWSDGGAYRAILHGATGAVVASLGGGDALQAALSAGSVERARGELAAYLVSQGIAYGSPEFDSLMELGSIALGGALGGGSGAATALLGEQYNRQLHPDEINWLSAHAASFAAQVYGCGSACTPEQIQAAKNRLIVEAGARVDAVMSERAGGVDVAAESFINTHPVTFAWGEGFTATREQYNDFRYFANLLSDDKQALTDLAVALGDAGWTKQDFQDAYHDQLLAVASATRGENGVAMLEMFTGDIGMVLGIVRKLVQGDTQGAGTDVVLSALPWGVAKVAGGAVRQLASAGDNVVWLNGKKIGDTWVSADGELTWRNPLTNTIEVVPDTAKVNVDHILPQNAIKQIDGFNELPTTVQNQLLNDPVNLQPMVKPANCSKGCRVEGIDGGWMMWGNQPVSPAYKADLEKAQQAFRDKVEKAIKAYRAPTGG